MELGKPAASYRPAGSHPSPATPSKLFFQVEHYWHIVFKSSKFVFQQRLVDPKKAFSLLLLPRLLLQTLRMS